MKFDRNQAIAIAMDEIRTGGYEQASVKALSQRLGISRSSFYNTFKSREDLFAEIITHYLPSAPDAPLYAPIIGPVLPVIESVLHNLCKIRASEDGANGCIIVNSLCELCPSEESPALMLTTLANGSTRRFEELLSVAKVQGEIATDANIHALALSLQNLMIGLNVLSKVVRSEDELWLLTETTLKGLGLLGSTR